MKEVFNRGLSIRLEVPLDPVAFGMNMLNPLTHGCFNAG